MRLLITTAAAAMLLAACSQPTDKAEVPAAPSASAQAASTDVYPFKIGALDAMALRDGGMQVPNDNAIFGLGQTPQTVGAVLSSAGLPTDKIDLSIQPLLIRDGDRTVLIDTGTGGSMGPTTGKLQASLKAAGVAPASVTDILISHSHGDHVGGLVGGDGALAFPNATVRMSAAEWTFMRADPQMAAIVKAITPKVQTFAPGAEVAPGITSVDLSGHTPGHSAFEIVSGGDKLLYVGDTVHHPVISVQRPQWPIEFDTDKTEGVTRRTAELRSLAASGERVYAVHLPFPGLGKVTKRGEGLVWTPETPARP